MRRVLAPPVYSGGLRSLETSRSNLELIYSAQRCLCRKRSEQAQSPSPLHPPSPNHSQLPVGERTGKPPSPPWACGLCYLLPPPQQCRGRLTPFSLDLEEGGERDSLGFSHNETCLEGEQALPSERSPPLHFHGVASPCRPRAAAAVGQVPRRKLLRESQPFTSCHYLSEECSEGRLTGRKG